MISILLNKALPKIKKKEISQTFGLRLFIDKSYLSNDGSQKFLIFEPIYKTFTMAANLTDTIVE